MKMYEFPYRIHKGSALPLIPVILAGKEETYALVDSGASLSLFEAWVAERIGIEVEKGKKRFLTGIGGRVLAYEHLVPMKVAEVEFNCRIAFTRELKVSLNLLGQDNFFDKFNIAFDRTRLVVQLTPKG